VTSFSEIDGGLAAFFEFSYPRHPLRYGGGYLLGGWLGPTPGMALPPFYGPLIFPCLLAVRLRSLFLSGTAAGQFDSVQGTKERGHCGACGAQPGPSDGHSGHGRRTFSLEIPGVDAYLLSPLARYSLESGESYFWQIVFSMAFCSGVAVWRLARDSCCRVRVPYYFVSAVSMALGVPVIFLALFNPAGDCARNRRAAVLLLLYLAPHTHSQLGRFPHSRQPPSQSTFALFHRLGVFLHHQTPWDMLLTGVAAGRLHPPRCPPWHFVAVLFYGMRFRVPCNELKTTRRLRGPSS